MTKHADFLVEIQTEELPPKALRKLAESFRDEIKKRLTEAKLEFADIHFFATPRRLAVKVDKLIEKQADSIVERRGPAWQAAFDASGKPTPACLGFARSCGITPEQFITIENTQGKWVGFNQTVLGKSSQELLPEIVQQSLNALPIPKRMRWGSNTAEFVRPVHSVIMLYGSNVVNGKILGCKAGRETLGHRFHYIEEDIKHLGYIEEDKNSPKEKKPKKLIISSPNEYANILENEGHVIADFEQRKNKIREQIEFVTERWRGKRKALVDEKLLDEVTGLVEWPIAILGEFDPSFLRVPQEALISAMQDHQRYFPLVDENHKLLPYFITISNIESKNRNQVIEGNQRVLRARLSDAAFFFDTDKKIKLGDRLEKLKDVVFQAKLGTLYDKAERVSKLAAIIAEMLQLNVKQARQAALLSKADLTTELVGEFPELQGIAGYYYALHDDEDNEVAVAIRDHYRFLENALPETKLGCVVALADRLDTLVGIFKIGLAPTGDKDPYGLRRAAISILRILIANEIDLDAGELLGHAREGYGDKSLSENDEVWNFISGRLERFYQESGEVDIFRAVASIGIKNPTDMNRRIKAVRHFKQLPEAESLSVANKRVSNILAQAEVQLKEVNESLFEHDAERQLAKLLNQCEQKVKELVQEKNYQEALSVLAKLREPVDGFFDQVMVMVDNQETRENRLALLKKLRKLFLQVADIALLQP